MFHDVPGPLSLLVFLIGGLLRDPSPRLARALSAAMDASDDSEAALAAVEVVRALRAEDAPEARYALALLDEAVLRCRA